MRRMPWPLLVLLAGPLFAQSGEEWFLDRPIEAVVFAGLQAGAERELEPVVRPYVGRPFTLELFWDLQAKLYALDRFQTIEGDALPAGTGQDGVIVRLRVTDMPVVREIALDGRGALGAREVLEALPFRRGERVSEARFQVGKQAVLDLYRRQGYPDAGVSGALEPAGPAGSVRARYVIAEGPRTTIREVRFEGNSVLPYWALNRVMETRSETSFRPGLLDESVLEADLARIRDLYGRKGHPDARVVRVERQAEAEAAGDRVRLTLTLHIEEGPRYTYGGMEFEGNRIFSDARLKRLLREKPGDVLDRQALREDYQRVVDLYQDHGYIYNPIELQEVVDGAAHVVSARVRIEELEPAHIERVIVRGNRRTREEVVTRDLPFRAGEVFDKSRVIEGLRSLYASGYFSSVSLETPPGSAPGLVDLVIEVEEARTDNLNLGVRLSGGSFPLTGTLGWSDRNFLGRGQSIGALLEVSDRRQALSAGFGEPRLFGSRWSGGASLSVEHATVAGALQDLEPPFGVPEPYTSRAQYEEAMSRGETVPEDYRMDYSTWSIAARLEAGNRTWTPLGWLGLKAGLGASLDHLGYDEDLYRPLDPALREGVNGWSLANRLGVTVYLDSRDRVLNPTSGWYLGQGFTYAGGLLLGDRHYLRLETAVEGYLPLLDLPVTDTWSLRMVLAARSRLGLVLPQLGRSGVVANPDELLGLDGMSAARGWAPVTGSKAVWDSSLELRLPVAERFLWSSLFFDAAAAWAEPGDIGAATLEDFRFSLGAGLQVTAPQFPVQVYLSKSFRVSDGRVQWLDGDMPFLGLGLNLVINLNPPGAREPGRP